MANQALIQSGLNLAKSVSQEPDIGGAFAEGAQIITDQIEKNADTAFQNKKREYELARLEDEKFLREQNVERGMMAYEAEKGATFAALDEGIKNGSIDPVDYEGFIQNREEWWKDQANRLKTAQDLPKIKQNLKLASTAEANWPNILQFAQGVNISDSSGEAQQMDMAIDRWSETNGATPPPIREQDGELVYVIPTIDGQEEVYIPLKNAGRAKSASDVYGQYSERTTFSGVQADFISSQPQLDQIFRDGKATEQSLNSAMRFFESRVTDPMQMIELADDLLMTPGIDKEALGLSEAADLDANGDGQISGDEMNKFKELFGAVLEAQYGEQDFSRQGNNNYTPEQVGVYNAMNQIAQNPTNLNALLRLPNVFDIQQDPDNGRAVIFIGDSRKEQNAFVIEWPLTEQSFQKLQDKFGYVDVNPQEEKIEDPATDETPTEEVQNVQETPAEQPVEQAPSKRRGRTRGETKTAKQKTLEKYDNDPEKVQTRIDELKDLKSKRGRRGRGWNAKLANELRDLENALKEEKPGTTRRRRRRR